MADVIIEITELNRPPQDSVAFERWLAGTDAVAFLEHNARERELVVYAGLPHTFIHGLLVPAPLLDPPDIDDLMNWNMNASSSWGITCSFDPPEVWLSPSLENTGSDALDRGEQLVFSRYFEGRLGASNYVEVLQKFIHVLGLHYLQERDAYCRLDRLGDVEDVIRTVAVPGTSSESLGTVVLFDRRALDEYMLLTDTAMVRTFDFTRWRSSYFHGWKNLGEPQMTRAGDVFYRSHLEVGNAAYERGIQILRPIMPRAELIERHTSFAEPKREYASFAIYDWKNGAVKTVSSAPGHTANYFTESELPFETSPAFFRSEVLAKYKADPDKYRVQDRSISCRGAWHLQTYDINEEGQIHTYIVYLRSLPYEEQLHWKAYNEPPRGTISKRAFTTDFLGEWDHTYDPLQSLREIVEELRRAAVPWWSLRSSKLEHRVHYPVTGSAEEWASALMNLDQLLVEGFEKKWLKRQAEALGQIVDSQLGSLKVMERYLVGSGWEEANAQELTSPLHELHNLRSKLKGHASGDEATSIKRSVLMTHRSYGRHFRDLCARCDGAMRKITEAVSKRHPKEPQSD